ncbi:MAG: hypothetical protein AUH33_04175 [Chloroflexi bacterium 13_1_40CM_68_21]|nr:MAG: hypothetical protein AUH33_04175 [Chloroflexi bacterium 13_1_40CM_68_21]
MARMNRTIIRNEQAFAAGDAAITDNLPVNPLSFVDVVLRGQNLTLNTLSTLAQQLAALTRIEILLNGSSIISITPADLLALQTRLQWAANLPQPRGITAGHRWRHLLRVSFSRVPFWLKEGFPATKSGALQIRYTPAAAFTNVGTVTIHTEAVEVLDAVFDHYLKYTTLSRTPAATGESDQDLPIGNDLVSLLLFGTTVPTAGSDNASMREVRLLIDNQEAFIPRSRWDALHHDFQSKGDLALWLAEHIHLENTAAAYAQNADTLGPRWDAHVLANYGYMDFSPLNTEDYFVPTAGRSQVKLRINADVADAQRIIPVERLAVAGAAIAAP